MIGGVLVGGRSRRMGGRPKGLLLAPTEPDGSTPTVVARTVALLGEVCDEVVLVGAAGAYLEVGVPGIEDDPRAGGEGPLAGLAALLDRARGGVALAVACDMPYVTRVMFARLASYAPDAAVVAPRHDDVWSPLFARYDAARVAGRARAALASGERALQPLLDAWGARELPLTDDERCRLRDWDTPADVEESVR